MTERIKITYIISKTDKALSFEWIAESLSKNLFQPSFILLNPGQSELEEFLRNKKFPVINISIGNKILYPFVLIRLWWILYLNKPSIIHCHLFDATVLGLLAGKLAGIKTRIYTRHHATIHYRDYPSGRKWDILNNMLATDIIAISDNIKDILIHWDKAQPNKITKIPHGFKETYFTNDENENLSLLRLKYSITIDYYPVIGVISRYTEWKGIQYVIPAFRAFRKKFPHAHLILANAQGDYSRTIKGCLSALPPGSYTEIPFEKDLVSLYKLFNIFVHVPADPMSEAFGQTYVESLLVGIPSVFTLSGIAAEFIKDGENAMVAYYKNSDQILDKLLQICENKELQKKLIQNGKESVKRFSLENHMKALENLYLQK